MEVPMRVSSLVLGMTLLAGAAAVPATAGGGRIACHLLTDPVGDTHYVAPGQNPAQLDIVSGDIATTRTRLVAVLRLRALSAPDPSSPDGRSYGFLFRANGHGFQLSADFATGGMGYSAWVDNTPGGDNGSATSYTWVAAAKGAVDLKHRLIRWVVPLRAFRHYASFNQTYIDHLGAFSAEAAFVAAEQQGSPVQIGPGGVANVTDEASSGSRYSPRAPSCLTA
jgi:hypothetical protein